jgi:hypothetical protein
MLENLASSSYTKVLSPNGLVHPLPVVITTGQKKKKTEAWRADTQRKYECAALKERDARG